MQQYALVHERMLQIDLRDGEVFSKKGSMVAYTGKVAFARSFLGTEGVQSLAGRALTNEGMHLMVARGTGSIYYARYGRNVTIVSLRGEMFYAESDSVLAFDARLRTGTVFMGNQGLGGVVRGMATGQGLFTTTFEGTGELAIFSDGDAIALDVTPDKPVFVDPDAYVGHKGQLSSRIVTDVSWKTFIGQTSGESYQLEFTGAGTVYIQASER